MVQVFIIVFLRACFCIQARTNSRQPPVLVRTFLPDFIAKKPIFRVCGLEVCLVSKCLCVFLLPTLLPGPVENLDVFQLHTNAGPELHSICSIVFAASFNGAIGMSSTEMGQLTATI